MPRRRKVRDEKGREIWPKLGLAYVGSLPERLPSETAAAARDTLDAWESIIEQRRAARGAANRALEEMRAVGAALPVEYRAVAAMPTDPEHRAAVFRLHALWQEAACAVARLRLIEATVADHMRSDRRPERAATLANGPAIADALLRENLSIAAALCVGPLQRWIESERAGVAHANDAELLALLCIQVQCALEMVHLWDFVEDRAALPTHVRDALADKAVSRLLARSRGPEAAACECARVLLRRACGPGVAALLTTWQRVRDTHSRYVGASDLDAFLHRLAV